MIHPFITRDLFGNDYWHRVWVIQEVTLAKSLYIVQGRLVAPWDNVAKLALPLKTLDKHVRDSRSNPKFHQRAASLESTGMPMLHKELRKGVKSEDNICLRASLQERSSKKPGRLSDECLRGRVGYRMGGQEQSLFLVNLKVSMTKPSLGNVNKSIPVMPYMRPQDKDPGRYVFSSSEPASSSLFIRSTNKLTPRVNLSAWRNSLLRQESGGLEHDKNNLIPFSSVVECRKKYQEASGSKRIDLITLMELFW
ncbi:hypothetical protein QBC38DRAFT_182578 [Podospora fimiseda]|uniref:Heterokaryon incompatibility domain-containing protein n=1 Tax=Podospora fimiseda TaxID=252190 RepID=A0AAN6YMB0_9PEZI|nr:hypothetical protein QBC38DRAFT_182578 [Podospora fimiseda]